jgi:Flp pilus assembly pilin Flp
MTSRVRKLWNDEDGLATVEYALVLSLVAIVAIAAWGTLGAKINNAVVSAAGSLQ